MNNTISPEIGFCINCTANQFGDSIRLIIEWVIRSDHFLFNLLIKISICVCGRIFCVSVSPYEICWKLQLFINGARLIWWVNQRKKNLLLIYLWVPFPVRWIENLRLFVSNVIYGRKHNQFVTYKILAMAFQPTHAAA